MRQIVTGLVAAFAVMTASAAPALACGGGLFTSCSPCGQTYVQPCAAPAPVDTGCNTGCGGWGYERLADPDEQYYAAPVRHQYYYVNQGPTYTGPGAFAPRPAYDEATTPYYGGYRAHPHYRAWHHGYRYSERPSYRYGHAPRTAYAPRYSLPPRGYYHHSMRYGMPMPHHYGYREHTLRRYY